MPKIDIIRTSTVFDGNIGWEHRGNRYRLACGAQLVQTINGDLLCAWMTGGDTEPADDHIFLYARSTDGGKSWGEPQVLVGEGEDNGSGNLFRVNDDLFAMCARWPAKERYTVWNFTRKKSLDNGHTWTDEVPITLLEGEGLSSSFGNLIRTSKGELLGCGTFLQKRETPLKAGVERLAFAKSEEEAQRMEPLLPGETFPLDFDSTIYGGFCFEASEDLTKFTPRGRVDVRPLGLLEGNIIELRDGRLAFLMRAEWGGFLWRSDSEDGGYTWSAPYATNIPNASSLAQLIRLPDDRIALFHNPVGGVVGKRGSRDRLSIWVSNDEMESWYIQQDLVHGGYLSYPCPIILSNGGVAFTYDKDRRSAEFVEVMIP